MASARILNLLALTALATLLTTLAPQPVQALEHRAVQFGRRAQHHQIAENQIIKKRSSSKKCRARPSSSSLAPTSTQKDSSTPTPKPTSTKDSQPKPTQTHSSGSSSPPSLGGGKKFGLAWGNDPADLKYYKNFPWFYNWQANKPSEADKYNVPYYPQFWGTKNKQQFIDFTKNGDYELYLGFNEPNEGGQSDMSPEEGVSLWKEVMTPLRNKGKRLGSPVTSSNPNGLTWVKTFKDKCGSECNWDVTTVHWYDTTPQKFKDYCTLWHTTFGLPILITEWAFQNFNGGDQPSEGQIYSYMAEIIPWLESQDWILGYAVYGFMNPLNINDNMLCVNSNAQPNALGNYILGLANI